MGNARWSGVDWNAHASAHAHQTQRQVFQQSGMHADLDPSKIKFREAVDSQANPETTPIVLATDVTGSMGILAETVVKTSLGEIMGALYDRKPVTDPQIMCMAIGDANVDHAPLQATQFEASLVLAEQVKKIWIEGGGGGNGGESYALAWAFAAYKTKCDAIRKRKRKGYLFTIGDEAPHATIKREHLQQFLGMPAESDMDAKVLLAHIQQDWHVFHLIVKPIGDQDVVGRWKALMGERALLLSDHAKMASGIVAIIQLVEGHADAATVQNGWDGDQAIVVRNITAQLVKT